MPSSAPILQPQRHGRASVEAVAATDRILPARHPERTRDMIGQYYAWAKRCGVIPREKIVQLTKAEGGTAFPKEEKRKRADGLIAAVERDTHRRFLR
jgi:hypothetical protein